MEDRDLPLARDGSSPEPSVRAGTALVADDEPAVLRIAERILQRLGYEVLSAADGLETVELFEQRHTEIHVVLLDLTMPKLSGEEVLQRIRKRAPAVPIILSSGYSEQETRARFAGHVATAFLQKPWSPSQLEQAISKLREPSGD